MPMKFSSTSTSFSALIASMFCCKIGNKNNSAGYYIYYAFNTYTNQKTSYIMADFTGHYVMNKLYIC
jgi:hypothetical protein